jgi:hypothetical protein
MSDVANQAGERSFDWQEGPPPPDMTEPGLPFGPMELRKQNQLENISNAPKMINEGGYPWNEPMQQPLELGPDPESFNARWDEWMANRELPFDPNVERPFKSPTRKTLEAYDAEVAAKQAEAELPEPTEFQGRLNFGRVFPKIDKAFYEALAKDITPEEARRGLSHGYARSKLAKVKKGPPGLTILPDHPERASGWNSYQVTFRDNTGKPVAHATIWKSPNEGVKVSTFAADKTRGSLYGDAVLEMLHAFNKLKVTGATGTYSKHTAKLIEHLKKYVKD